MKGKWRMHRYTICVEAIKNLKIATTKDIVEWQVAHGYHHSMTVQEACWYMKQLCVEGKCKKVRYEHKAATYTWIGVN